MANENALADSKAEAQKAHAALRAARAPADLELFDDAASRLYYAAFHLVSAALVVLGVQAQTHAGVAALLGQHLVKPGLLPASVSHDLASLLGLRGQVAPAGPHVRRGVTMLQSRNSRNYADIGRFTHVP